MPAFGTWKTIASNLCVGAKNNQFAEFTYKESSVFFVAMRLDHTSGKIGCRTEDNTNWGCDPSYPMNMIITDTRNKRIFPAPTLITLSPGNWYTLPGYTENSPTIAFAVPGYQWLYHGQTFRIWYGEDLAGHTEHDNHGKTCMNVLVHTALENIHV
ncbi:uncharacterized protein LOC124444518 [Xenia sp. Carnegie-2017]|uniref:uncharacterized protein LOC124444518 n=1 Tax=Xenia sp. Carnegie-2017 TaxID=2897299 RepID=UPI001F03E47D|nr:uncharacterized protein LOC124444518 [Xenia sp. Carnegie-2017]